MLWGRTARRGDDPQRSRRCSGRAGDPSGPRRRDSPRQPSRSWPTISATGALTFEGGRRRGGRLCG
eukprot:10758490-Lingulodinium_polyedra.AAC.1